MDASPKILTLPRSDCALCFASFNADPPGPAGQRSTDVTVPQRANSLDSRFHVNAGYPFQDAHQMAVHVISIMKTFTNAVGIAHPTTGQ